MSELKQIQVGNDTYDIRDDGAVRAEQGAENAGKLLGIGDGGAVGPVSRPIDAAPTEGSPNAVSSGGVWSALQESGGGGIAFPTRQMILTTSQTLDLSALGIKVGDAIALICIGGGGCGGGSGYVESGFFAVTELTVAVTIGAGGAGGANRYSGGNGGTTSFGSLLSAAGGNGGAAGSSSNGTAGNGGAGGNNGDAGYRYGGDGGNGWTNVSIGKHVEAGSAISGSGCVMLWY